MDPDQPHRSLLARAQRGEAAAFAELMAAFDARLLAFLRRRGGRLLGGDADAEDLLQTVLADAWRLLPGFEDRGPESLYRWLVAMAGHAVQDRRRYLEAKGRDRVVDLGASWSEPAALLTSVARRAIRRETAARVVAALDRLPDGHREVVARHFLDGMTLGEIGADLGITKNAVWERLHRGLDQLRWELAPSGSTSAATRPRR